MTAHAASLGESERSKNFPPGKFFFPAFLLDTPSVTGYDDAMKLRQALTEADYDWTTGVLVVFDIESEHDDIREEDYPAGHIAAHNDPRLDAEPPVAIGIVPFAARDATHVYFPVTVKARGYVGRVRLDPTWHCGKGRCPDWHGDEF